MDYSKHLITADTLGLLSELANQAGVKQAITAMFAGQLINNSEQRPALHIALRSPRKHSPEEQAVHNTLDKIAAFVESIQSGNRTGLVAKQLLMSLTSELAVPIWA